MTEVTVRSAIVADLSALSALLEEVDELHRRALPWLFRRVEGPEQTAFRDGFVSKPDHAAWLAVAADGTLAGVVYVCLRATPRAPIVVPAVVAELDTLVVKSSFRRQGIGKRLVAAALEWATLAGASRIELGVHHFNEPARAFWASVGFEIMSYRLVRHAELPKNPQ